MRLIRWFLKLRRNRQLNVCARDIDGKRYVMGGCREA